MFKYAITSEKVYIYGYNIKLKPQMSKIEAFHDKYLKTTVFSDDKAIFDNELSLLGRTIKKESQLMGFHNEAEFTCRKRHDI